MRLGNMFLEDIFTRLPSGNLNILTTNWTRDLGKSQDAILVIVHVFHAVRFQTPIALEQKIIRVASSHITHIFLDGLK